MSNAEPQHGLVSEDSALSDIVGREKDASNPGATVYDTLKLTLGAFLLGGALSFVGSLEGGVDNLPGQTPEAAVAYDNNFTIQTPEVGAPTPPTGMA